MAAAIAYRRRPTRVTAQGSLSLLSPAAAAALSPFLLLTFIPSPYSIHVETMSTKVAIASAGQQKLLIFLFLFRL